MGMANHYMTARQYDAISSGDTVEWTVSVATLQPTVSDNQSSFKFVKVSIPEDDADKFALKKKLDVSR